MPKPKLTIPIRYRKSLACLLKMGDSAFGAVLEGLRRAPSSLLRDDLVDHIVGALPGSEPKETRSIVRTLTGLAGAWPDGINADDFVRDITTFMREHPEDFDGIDLDHARVRLLELLPLEPLLVSGRGQAIASEHERSFCSARVLSDVRSIFRRDPDAPPVGAAIIHVLRISFHEDATDPKDFFVALDLGDIQELMRVLERALHKDASLRAVLGKADISVIDTGGPHA